MLRKFLKKESGSIMVEAAIYFPLVILAVFAMIYFGMVKYQDSILTFKTQKFATAIGREISYPGYQADYSSAAVDFRKNEAESFNYASYYKTRCENIYNDFKFNYQNEASSYAGELKKVLSQKSFLTGLQVTTSVNIENLVIAQRANVVASYKLESPAFLRKIGVPDFINLHTSIIQTASSPSEFAETADLAVDLVSFLLEKIGVKDDVDAFLDKIEHMKSKIPGLNNEK